MSQKKRKRKYARHRRNMIGTIITVVVLIGMTAGGIGWMNLRASGTRKKDTSPPPKAIEIQTTKKEDSSQEGLTDRKSDENAQQDQAADRSSFAVVPGQTAGTTEQTDEKVVYLTLDDGPSELTPKVLEILDRYQAKATFFITNQNPEYAYLIKEAYDKGHTIGLHTYSHDYQTVYASVDAYFSDLEAIGKVAEEQIGYVPCFIRFPGGSSNTISANYTSGIMTTLAKEVQNRGYQYYDWNASSGDGSVQPVENLIANAKNCSENNIVLLSHDANGKETTIEALPAIIEYYQSQGYVFKALDRESYAPHHGINN